MPISEASLLLSHPLFARFSEDELSFALSLLSASPRHFQKGETLIRMGDAFTAFGLVTAGAVQVYTDDIDGNHMLMASVGAGDSFGESLAFFATEGSPVYVTATEDGSLLWLSAAALREALLAPKRSREAALLCERFTALLAARALSQNERIQILSKPTIRERIVTFLTQWEHKTKSRTFRIPFDRASLADYLGVNRAALSRELSKMKKEGILDFFRSSFQLLQ